MTALSPLRVRILARTSQNASLLYHQSKRGILDFSSDVRTVPTDAMRSAMYHAKVGDEQIGSDPTINELQCRMSKVLGKESALFVPSGIMGNLLSVMAHCDDRQSEMILGHWSHIHISEAGGSAFLAGVHSRIVPNTSKGQLPFQNITESIRWASSYDVHSPKTKLLCLENTHNRCGGVILDIEYMRSVRELLNETESTLGYRIPIHLDGARLFNAAVATNCDIAELAEYADSVTVCFSKGLGCPVGSVMAGSNSFIERAKRFKKALGGAMRQSGVLAAPCLVALDEMIPKLSRDHERAKYVHRQIEGINGLNVHPPDTNILMFEIGNDFGMTDQEFMRYMTEDRGIKIHRWTDNVYRVVFHHQIDDEMTNVLLDAFRQLESRQTNLQAH